MEFAKNKELKARAKLSLASKDVPVGQVTFFYVVIAILAGTGCGGLIIWPLLDLGYTYFNLKLSRTNKAEYIDFYSEPSRGLSFRAIGVNFFTILFCLLWTLLLIVPGIIKAISYSQAYLLIIDNPNLKAREAITKSKELMEGYKGKFFSLFLSLIPSFLIIIITLGIGVFWQAPKIQMSFIKFYEELLAVRASKEALKN